MNLEIVFQFLVRYWAIFLVVSLAFAFLGYYLIRVSLALIGFFAGVYLGEYLWLQLISKYGSQIQQSNEKILHLGVIFMIAFLTTAFFISFYKVAVFIAGFTAGGAMSYYVYNWVLSVFKISVKLYPELVGFGVFITFGFIVGLVILKSEKKAVGTALATLGSLVASYSIMVPLSTYFKVLPKHLLYSLTDGRHIFMLTVFILIFLTLSVFSVKIQIGKSTKENNRKNNKGEIED